MDINYMSVITEKKNVKGIFSQINYWKSCLFFFPSSQRNSLKSSGVCMVFRDPEETWKYSWEYLFSHLEISLPFSASSMAMWLHWSQDLNSLSLKRGSQRHLKIRFWKVERAYSKLKEVSDYIYFAKYLQRCWISVYTLVVLAQTSLSWVWGQQKAWLSACTNQAKMK